MRKPNLLLLLGLMYLLVDVTSKLVDHNNEIANKTSEILATADHCGVLISLPKEGEANTRKSFGLVANRIEHDPTSLGALHPESGILVDTSVNLGPLYSLLNKEIVFDVNSVGRAINIRAMTNHLGCNPLDYWPVHLHGHTGPGQGKHRTGVINTISTSNEHFLLNDMGTLRFPVKLYSIDGQPCWLPDISNGKSIYYQATDTDIRTYYKSGSIAVPHTQKYPLVYAISTFHWHDFGLPHKEFLRSIGINVL